jgi:hypothetical protein
VDDGNLDLDALATRLRNSRKQAYVRALLMRRTDCWELYHAWALIGAEPPHWAAVTWEYHDLAFVSHRMSAGGLTIFNGGGYKSG